MAGWPPSLPVDEDLRRRAYFELSRTSVQADYVQRSERAGLRHRSSSVVGVLAVALFPFAIQIVGNVLGFGPAAMGLLVGVAIMGQLVGVCILIPRARGPSLRAGLRRLNVDCCVRCGQIIRRERDDSRCPECGFRHGDFPLGWGPGVIRDGAVQSEV